MAGACDSVNHLLSPYLDNELSGPDRAVVESHLQGCASCPKRLADLQATQSALEAYLQQRADEVDFSGFAGKVLAQIKKEPLPLGQRLRVRWTELMAYHAGAIYSAFGAGAVATLVVGLVLTRPAPRDNTFIVHSLQVSDPRYEPVVMHTDDGETVIMLVEHSADSDSSDAKSDAPEGAATKAPAADGPTGAEKPKVGDVPHGGEL